MVVVATLLREPLLSEAFRSDVSIIIIYKYTSGPLEGARGVFLQRFRDSSDSKLDARNFRGFLQYFLKLFVTKLLLLGFPCPVTPHWFRGYNQIDSTRIPSAVKSRTVDAPGNIYMDVIEGSSLDAGYHGGGFMELTDMQQLVKDSNDPSRFRNVLVPNRELHKVLEEAKAARDSAGFLLNGVSEILFSLNELASAKGITKARAGAAALDEEKVDALFAKHGAGAGSERGAVHISHGAPIPFQRLA
ncbi:hypothetical protein NDU88_009182 [Pleurodeles waltl]|uniref:Uncharacterized protein n=1 Tax=Pleurodeles waltl TaxID=8319 RepID=A0AAV7QSV0_PLEWA|nr:hypothetical protein NDU88_009182 [Pleurodeles waltl]